MFRTCSVHAPRYVWIFFPCGILANCAIQSTSPSNFNLKLYLRGKIPFDNKALTKTKQQQKHKINI